MIHLERESEKEKPWAGGGSSRLPARGPTGAAVRPRGLCPEPRQVLPRQSPPHAHVVPSPNTSVSIILLLLMSVCIVTVNLFAVMASVSAAQKGTAFGSLRGLRVFLVFTGPPARLTQRRCPALTRARGWDPPSEPPGLAEKGKKGRVTRGAVGVGGPGSGPSLSPAEVRRCFCRRLTRPGR